MICTCVCVPLQWSRMLWRRDKLGWRQMIHCGWKKRKSLRVVENRGLCLLLFKSIHRCFSTLHWDICYAWLACNFPPVCARLSQRHHCTACNLCCATVLPLWTSYLGPAIIRASALYSKLAISNHWKHYLISPTSSMCQWYIPGTLFSTIFSFPPYYHWSSVIFVAISDVCTV